MQKIQMHILRSAYRLRSKPIQSLNLHLISIGINMITALTLIDFYKVDPKIYQSNSALQSFDKVCRSIYFSFLNSAQYALQQAILVVILGGLQIVFLYLLQKQNISEFYENLLNIIHYFKLTFRLPILAILLYALVNPKLQFFVIIKILSVVIIIISSITQYLCDYLNFSYLYRNTTLTEGMSQTLYPKSRIIQKIILIYTIVRKDPTNIEITIQMTIILGLYLVLLTKLAISKIFKYHNVMQIANYMSWIFIVSFFVTETLNTFIDLVSNNLWLVLFSCFLWSSLAYYNILEYFKNNLLVRSPQLIHKQKQAITYMRLLFKTYKSMKETGNLILFLGLAKDHTNQCLNSQCICRKINKVSASSILKDDQFLIKFLQTNLEIIHRKFENSIKIFIICLSFYVEITNKFPQYFYQSASFTQMKLGLIEKFALYQIQQQASKLLDAANSGHKTTQNLELINQERQIEQCYDKFQQILGNITNLYRCNAVSHCGLNSLQKQLHLIYKLMLQLQLLFSAKNLQQIISIQFILLMIILNRNILNLGMKTKTIMKRLELIYKNLQVKQLNHDTFNVNMYSELGCVIQCITNKERFGYFKNISKNAYKLFQYPTSESLIGIQINKLLPKCLRNEHKLLMQAWIETGKYPSMNKIRSVCGCTYTENLFKCFIRVQLTVVNQELAIILAINKVDHQNYMIVNDMGQIDSCGKDFEKLLANESKGVQISEVFPKWCQIIAKLSSQQKKTVKTQLIPKQKNDRCSFRSSQMQSENKKIVDVTVQIKKKNIGDIVYYLIKKLMGSKKILKNTSIKYHLDEQFVELEDDDQLQINLENQFDSEGQPFCSFVLENASSSKPDNQSSIYSIERILQELSQKFKAGGHIKYPFLEFVNILLILIFVFIVCIIIMQLFIYMKGLLSYSNIIYANSLVSNNMQLLQILYNKIMMLQQYCSNQFSIQNCHMIIQSANEIYQYLFSLMTADMRDVVKNQSFFKHRYFSYEFVPVNMSINGNYYNVDTFQFMEYYIQSFRQINSQFEMNGKINNGSLLLIQNLKSNWNEMKRINHYNIQFYKGIGLIEVEDITRYIIILCVTCIILFTVYILLRYLLLRGKVNFLIKVLLLFRLIPVQASEKLIKYFTELQESIKTKNLRYISNIMSPDIRSLNSSTFCNYTKYIDYFSKIQIFVVWLILVFFFVISTFMMTKENGLWRSSLNYICDLMNSENTVLQSYFQLKAYYLYPPNQVGQEEELDSLLSILNISQIEFVRIALEINGLFNNNNVVISNEYDEILIGNICNITQSTISETQYQSCINDMTFKIMDEGILVAMTYFQRTVFQGLFDLSVSRVQPESFFKQIDFSNIDNYLFFMFKVFQIIQKKLNQTLDSAISQRVRILCIIAGIEIIALTFATLWMIITKKIKKKELSEIYGYALIFPVSLIKESKFIQQIFTKLLWPSFF